MRTEISQAKKEANFYLKNVEKGKAIDAMESRKRKRADQVRLQYTEYPQFTQSKNTLLCKDNCFILSSLSRGKMDLPPYSSQTALECIISPELFPGNFKEFKLLVMLRKLKAFVVENLTKVYR